MHRWRRRFSEISTDVLTSDKLLGRRPQEVVQESMNSSMQTSPRSQSHLPYLLGKVGEDIADAPGVAQDLTHASLHMPTESSPSQHPQAHVRAESVSSARSVRIAVGSESDKGMQCIDERALASALCVQIKDELVGLFEQQKQEMQVWLRRDLLRLAHMHVHRRESSAVASESNFGPPQSLASFGSQVTFSRSQSDAAESDSDSSAGDNVTSKLDGRQGVTKMKGERSQRTSVNSLLSDISASAPVPAPTYRRKSIVTLQSGQQLLPFENTKIRTSEASTIGGAMENWVCRLVQSRIFAICCSLTIATNSLLVGLHMNCNLTEQFSRWNAANHARCDRDVEWAISACCAIFTGELCLRVAAEGRDFFSGQNSSYNLFDTALVLSGQVHAVSLCIGDRSSIPNLTTFRLFRAIRMVQWFQSPRLSRFLRKLTLMISSVARMLLSLAWAILLLLLVMFLFGVIFAHGIALELRTSDVASSSDLVNRLSPHFRDLPMTMLTLFTAVSGGIDWYDLVSPLLDLGIIYGLLFIFYISFVFVGLLNVVTGIFVDSATQVSQLDRDIRVQEQLAEEEKYMRQLEHIFKEADQEMAGTLTWKQFEKHLQDDRIACYLSTLELDVSEARGLFKLLDLEEADEINIEDFISGCMRLKGPAKSIDLCTLMYENRKQMRRWADFTTYVENHFKILEETMGVESSSLRLSRTETWRDKKRRRDKFQHLHRQKTVPAFAVGNSYGPWSNEGDSDTKTRTTWPMKKSLNAMRSLKKTVTRLF